MAQNDVPLSGMAALSWIFGVWLLACKGQSFKSKIRE
jgi:hypothetical protein